MIPSKRAILFPTVAFSFKNIIPKIKIKRELMNFIEEAEIVVDLIFDDFPYRKQTKVFA